MGAIIGYDIPPDEPEMKECPVCNGTGHTGYRAFNIRTRTETNVTKQTWLCLPMDEDAAYDAGQNYCRLELETCQECGGTGKVEDDNDPWDFLEDEYMERYYERKITQ